MKGQLCSDARYKTCSVQFTMSMSQWLQLSATQHKHILRMRRSKCCCMKAPLCGEHTSSRSFGTHPSGLLVVTADVASRGEDHRWWSTLPHTRRGWGGNAGSINTDACFDTGRQSDGQQLAWKGH